MRDATPPGYVDNPDRGPFVAVRVKVTGGGVVPLDGRYVVVLEGVTMTGTPVGIVLDADDTTAVADLAAAARKANADA